MIKQRNVKRRQRPTLCIALLLAAAPLLAQPEAPDSASTTPSDGLENEPAATQQAPAPSEPAPTSSSSGTRTSSPFDYRSSEEISEDVPVSFPVDI